ncbi:hypothetical protein Pmani_004974 [Petrolisthes manimaculis]|uniref:Uncharacterized protein n=1 Tax=Petrolisthes manimaculis TaxID=1843537 RepID=A0AAE1QCP0_9EUCA|nr:hypothetical protein Pmani_004974 [Petrolisthes manimaculis]
MEEARSLGYTDTVEIRQYVERRQEDDRLERLSQREAEKEQREAEKEQREAEEREREHERGRWAHEQKMVELQAQANGSQSSIASPTTVTPRLQLARYVEGDEIEPFIERFEMLADTYVFGDDVKKIEFLNLFDGKALSILYRLDPDTRNYASMKKALLQAYGVTVDDARKQFLSASLQDKETVAQFSARLASHLDQWFDKAETPKTLEGIKDLLLRTQLEKSCPPELSAQIKTHKINCLKEMVEMSDAHFTAYGYHTRVQSCENLTQLNKPSQDSAGSYNKSSNNDYSQQQSQVVRPQPNPLFNHAKKQGNNYYSQQSSQYRYQGRSNGKSYNNNHGGNKGYYQRSAAATYTYSEPQYPAVGTAATASAAGETPEGGEGYTQQTTEARQGEKDEGLRIHGDHRWFKGKC